jgi:hypothetical protein
MPLARIEIEQTAAAWSGSVEAGGTGATVRRTTHFEAHSADAAIARALQAYREIVGEAAPVADRAADRVASRVAPRAAHRD